MTPPSPNQRINNRCADFNKIKNCSYMREGERSILRTFTLEKLLKMDMFISLCYNPAHNGATKLKI